MISKPPALTTSLSLRSPRVIVAGVLFIAALLSSFAFAALADQSSHYWAARNPITPGSLVTSEDLVLFDASLIENADLYFEENAPPIGMVSTQLIGAGQFLAKSALTQESAHFDQILALALRLPSQWIVRRLQKFLREHHMGV